jgi:outer membrane receptor protein involved in Fe transport
LQGPFGNIESFSQEFRLTGKLPPEGLSYIYGANYQSDKIADGIELLTPYYSGLPHDSSLASDYQVRYRAAGIFANADWEFLPRFTLTAGARYTSTHEALQGCLADGGNGLNSAFFGGYSALLRSFEGLSPPAPIAPGGCIVLDDRPTLPGGLATWLPYDPNLSQDEHNVSWRGGLNYKPTQDSLIYGLVSRGYKAGSFPASQNTFASEFKPVKQEQLTSYEVGTKLSLLDGIVQPNIAAFYYQYEDKQVLAYYLAPPLGLLSTYANVPKSKVEGVDADVAFVPISGLTIHPALTYLRSKVGSFVTYNDAGQLQNVEGNPLPYAPKLSGIVDVEYDMQVGIYTAFVGGHAQIESGTSPDLSDDAQVRIPGYSLFDARLGVRSQANWHASFWVRNLANHYYWTNVISSGDDFIKLTGLPRTAGLTVGVNFH